jgi:hypothetical protein
MVIVIGEDRHVCPRRFLAMQESDAYPGLSACFQEPHEYNTTGYWQGVGDVQPQSPAITTDGLKVTSFTIA